MFFKENHTEKKKNAFGGTLNIILATNILNINIDTL